MVAEELALRPPVAELLAECGFAYTWSSFNENQSWLFVFSPVGRMTNCLFFHGMLAVHHIILVSSEGAPHIILITSIDLVFLYSC